MTEPEKITAGRDLTIKHMAEIARLRAERDGLRAALDQALDDLGNDRTWQHLRAQRDQLVAALNLTMIGGNHLANVLIGRLGGGFAAKYPPSLDHEVALRSMGATDTYEVWCCWAAIMTARAAIAAVEEAKR